jgi:hypothetical protein
MKNLKLAENEKATIRACGWWPGCCISGNLIHQATFPARELGIIIRIAGIDTAVQTTKQKSELAQAASMTLFVVEQRSTEGVKKAGHKVAILSGPSDRPYDEQPIGLLP